MVSYLYNPIETNLMYKSILLLWLLTTLTFTFLSGQDQPNFILFIGDDISQADFGCYGHPTIKTPKVDQLAAKGVRFTNAYLTTSSCSPTRTSLITGRYPHNTGGPELHQTNNPHLKTLPQFPHLLQNRGYYTAQAGKWHFNGDPSKSFHQRYGGGDASGAGNWIQALKDRPREKPFFMWFAAFDAHRGWDAPLKKGPHHTADVIVPPYLVDGKETRKDLALYYNEVARFDTKIGEVIEELKTQGVYENTVIIVMADNGRPFPRDKTWLFDGGIKTPLVFHWPEGIRKAKVSESLVSSIDIGPTILDIAGVEVPESIQGVSLTKLFQKSKKTIRDFVFAERNWHGQRYHERLVRYKDLVYIKNHIPAYIGFNIVHYASPVQPAYVELVAEWKKGNLNPYQERALLVPGPEEMLFNVHQDPHQLKNLVEDSGYQDELQLLRKVLKQWIVETGDTAPAFEEMTPDRNSRESWKPIIPSGRPEGGIFPGQVTNAWAIHRRGPIMGRDVK